jgi:DNA-binding MarR family transcriptional regulator
MEERDSDPNLGLLMYDVARLMRANFHRRVRPLGLTQAQWRTLFHLARNEGVNQGVLAEILEIQPITLARLIDRLEAAGWAERRPDPADRRAFQLFVTAKAQPLLEQIRELAAETREEAMQGLGQTEREHLLDLLSALKNNLLATENTASQARAGRPVHGPVSEPGSRKRKRQNG